ncbi:MAG: hypothetical protein JW943_06000 [Deltaproteobacteria bacterium]|nr:hypothetical protein [Deltaproteobacteria bacterium]
MKIKTVIGVVFAAALIFWAANIFAATSGTLHCHKNGGGGNLGDVTVSFTLGYPSDSKEPARQCNSRYSACQGQCWGCIYWADVGGIAKCFDTNGSCHGWCD